MACFPGPAFDCTCSQSRCDLFTLQLCNTTLSFDNSLLRYQQYVGAAQVSRSEFLRAFTKTQEELRKGDDAGSCETVLFGVYTNLWREWIWGYLISLFLLFPHQHTDEEYLLASRVFVSSLEDLVSLITHILTSHVPKNEERLLGRLAFPWASLFEAGFTISTWIEPFRYTSNYLANFRISSACFDPSRLLTRLACIEDGAFLLFRYNCDRKFHPIMDSLSCVFSLNTFEIEGDFATYVESFLHAKSISDFPTRDLSSCASFAFAEEPLESVSLSSIFNNAASRFKLGVFVQCHELFWIRVRYNSFRQTSNAHHQQLAVLAFASLSCRGRISFIPPCLRHCRNEQSLPPFSCYCLSIRGYATLDYQRTFHTSFQESVQLPQASTTIRSSPIEIHEKRTETRRLQYQEHVVRTLTLLDTSCVLTLSSEIYAQLRPLYTLIYDTIFANEVSRADAFGFRWKGNEIFERYKRERKTLDDEDFELTY